jgi:hypothetical protein
MPMSISLMVKNWRRAAVAHVGAGDEVDATADAAAVDGGQHRLAAALQAGEGVLQVQDEAAQLFAHAGLAVVGNLLAQAHHHLQVDARREVPAFGLQHGHAGLGRGVHPVEGLADVLPHGGVHGVGLCRGGSGARWQCGLPGDAQGFKSGHGAPDFKPFWPPPSLMDGT